jgi:ribonuclease BN (tRNA processing enzyme)
MKLYILGCGDAFGSGGRNQSGYLVEAAERLFLLDCGPTTLLAMKRASFDPRCLDVIFLSHLHGDHCAGLPFFFIEQNHNKPRPTPLHVAGPPETEEKVRALFQLMYGSRSGFLKSCPQSGSMFYFRRRLPVLRESKFFLSRCRIKSMTYLLG